MLYRVFIAVTALAVVLASACTSPETEAAPTASPPVTPEVDLSAARDMWDRQGIVEYEIEVRKTSTFYDQTHMLSVEGADVAEATAECAPALADAGRPCSVTSFDAETFTVPGLFEVAESQTERDGGRWTTIKLDEKYGFPTTISYSNREVLDGWVFWTVTRFEAKP